MVSASESFEQSDLVAGIMITIKLEQFQRTLEVVCELGPFKGGPEPASESKGCCAFRAEERGVFYMVYLCSAFGICC